MVWFALFVAAQEYIPASPISMLRIVNTCHSLESLLAFGLSSVLGANGWGLRRSDTVASLSFVEQSITTSWPRRPRITCGALLERLVTLKSNNTLIWYQCFSLPPLKRESKTFLDSGFWIQRRDSGFQLLDLGFFVIGTWISDSNR